MATRDTAGRGRGDGGGAAAKAGLSQPSARWAVGRGTRRRSGKGVPSQETVLIENFLGPARAGSQRLSHSEDGVLEGF